MAFIESHELDSLDQIEKKYHLNYYHTLDRLLEDIESLVLNTIEKRC